MGRTWGRCSVAAHLGCGGQDQRWFLQAYIQSTSNLRSAGRSGWKASNFARTSADDRVGRCSSGKRTGKGMKWVAEKDVGLFVIIIGTHNDNPFCVILVFVSFLFWGGRGGALHGEWICGGNKASLWRKQVVSRLAFPLVLNQALGRRGRQGPGKTG